MAPAKRSQRPTTGASPPLTAVAAAVIRDSEGEILLARRPAGRHMAGLWEFPGGKVREGEKPAQEFRSELDNL